MNVVTLDKRTLNNMMLSIIRRKDTIEERQKDNELFIKCAQKFVDLVIHEKTSKGKGRASARRNESNRSGIRTNVGKQKVGWRNTDVAI